MSAPAEKPCDAGSCNGVAVFSWYCGAFVCGTCDKHVGICYCDCGWALSGRDGYAELIECGEVIEPEDY